MSYCRTSTVTLLSRAADYTLTKEYVKKSTILRKHSIQLCILDSFSILGANTFWFVPKNVMRLSLVSKPQNEDVTECLQDGTLSAVESFISWHGLVLAWFFPLYLINWNMLWNRRMICLRRNWTCQTNSYCSEEQKLIVCIWKSKMMILIFTDIETTSNWTVWAACMSREVKL